MSDSAAKYRALVQGQQAELQRLVTVNGVAPIRRMYESIIDDLLRQMRGSGLGAFRMTQLQGMLGQARLAMAHLLRSSTGVMGEAAHRIGLASAETALQTAQTMERIHSVDAVVPMPIIQIGRLRGLIGGQASTLMRMHETSMARYGTHLVGEFEREIAGGLAVGENSFQMQKRVEKVGDLQWYPAERIVRTELAHTYNAVHRATTEEQSEMVDGDLWSRWEEHVSDQGIALDDRVGDDSLAMHGQVAPSGGAFTQPPRAPRGQEVSESLVGQQWMFPPNRPNDRAVLAPWRLAWGDSHGWIWRGRRVPATQEIIDLMSGGGRRRTIVPADVSTNPEPPPVAAAPIAAPVPLPAPPPPPPPPLVQRMATAEEEARAQIAAMAPKKNPRRVAAAKIAAEASAQRRREIHSAVKSDLPPELHIAWEAEGHKFLQQEHARIRGIKDPINAASKISEAFTETYGSGEATAFGNEGDRFFKRAELEAAHAEKWADEQESQYYAEMQRAALEAGEINEAGELTKRGVENTNAARDEWGDEIAPEPVAKSDDDEPPF